VVYLERNIAEMREILYDLQDTVLNGRIYGKVVNDLAIGWGKNERGLRMGGEYRDRNKVKY
jgi:hypothetical protein